MLAGRSGTPPAPKVEAPVFNTVDILVAKSDIAAGADAVAGRFRLGSMAGEHGERQFHPQDRPA